MLYIYYIEMCYKEKNSDYSAIRRQYIENKDVLDNVGVYTYVFHTSLLYLRSRYSFLGTIQIAHFKIDKYLWYTMRDIP